MKKDYLITFHRPCSINTLVELSGLSLDAPAVLPAHFRVCACIIECPSLHEPRQRVGTVCGVDLSAFDAHVTDVAPELLELQGFLWEQPDVKVLCEPKVLWQHSTWPLSRSDLQQRLTASFDIVRDGALHAAVLWPEYLYEGVSFIRG